MNAPASHSDIPEEYRRTVEPLLQREPEHSLDDGDESAEQATGRFSLARFLKPYRLKLLVAFAIVVTSTVVNNIGPLIFAKAIDYGIVGKDFGLLLTLSLVYLGTVLLRVALRYFSTRYIGDIGQDLLYRLRNRVFSHLQTLSYEYHNKTQAGHTLAILTSDINTLSSLLQDSLINFVVQGLVLIVITSVLFYMNVPLTLILLCTVVPPMMAVTLWFRKTSSARFRQARARSADVTADLRQSLYGIKQIHIFNRAPVNIAAHEAVVDRYRNANDESAKLTSRYSAITDFIEVAAQAIVLYFGFRYAAEKNLSIGELVAFALFLSRFFSPLEQLALLFREYQSARAALDKISRFLSVPPAIVEVPDAVEMADARGDICFRDVSFSYGDDEMTLKNIDLQVRSGEYLAIVGATGSGKSTLIKLLGRLLDPATGTIEIAGQDIGKTRLASLRTRIGFLQQDPFLFHGSLRDNIVFANHRATEAQIEAACRSAQLSDLIARLPQGLDSSVHEQGASLSAGERQLVAIARLLLTDPDVVVMDEATSNLDPQTELNIEVAMRALSNGRTTIVISHRLDAVARADRIVAMGDGRILEIGTHAELMARNGVYAAMLEEWKRRVHTAAESA